jgi:hypothetical protein
MCHEAIPDRNSADTGGSWERIPEFFMQESGDAEILRLRDRFASRTGHSAQDDKPLGHYASNGRVELALSSGSGSAILFSSG